MKWLLFVFLLAPLTDLVAQEKPVVALGAQVRVESSSSLYWVSVGSIVALEADTLVLQLKYGGPLVIPLPILTKFEVRAKATGRWEEIPLSSLVGLHLGSLRDLGAQEAPPAQEGSPVIPGARVRVKVPSEPSLRPAPSPIYQQDPWTWRVGTVVTLDADTLVLKVKDRTALVAVPLASITEFKVSRSRKRLQGSGLEKTGVKVLGGTVGGIGGAAGGLTLLLAAGYTESTEGPGFYLIIPLLFYFPGSALGVHHAGKIYGETGSFPATLGGSLLGSLIVLGVFNGWVSDNWPVDFWPFVWGLFGASSIGATIGFNMTSTTDYWESVPLPLSVGFLPHGGGYVVARFEFGR